MLNGSQSLSKQHLLNPHPPGIASQEESYPHVSVPFVALSPTLRRLLLQAEIIAPRLRLAVLEGEAGTGKHLFAQTIHQLSHLAGLPFRRHDAREWLANEIDPSALSGTLYLDRVDLLAPIGQALLLRFIKALQTNTAPPQFLLLASAHSSLRLLAGQSLFLPDLAFRLSAIRFSIPPLREHREDIAPITQLLIDRICRRYQQPIAMLAQGTIHRLLQHTWPGNVRELASVIETAVLDSATGIIRPSDLALIAPIQPPAHTAHSAAASPLPPAQGNPPEDLTLNAAIQRHLQRILDLNRGNKLRAARQLGISRSTLYRLLAGETISSETTPQS